MNTVPDKCPYCESPIMVHGGNLMRSEDGGFATYECQSSRDVQWSDPQWSRSGQTEVCRIREIMLLGRQLSVANERIKRLEEALNTLVKMHRSFIGKDDGITHERSYYCFYKGQYDHWKKAIDVLEAKEAKP